MPSTPAWLASAEAVLNRNIAASSEAKTLIKRLENTRLQINVEGFTRVRAECLGGRLSLLAADDSRRDPSLNDISAGDISAGDISAGDTSRGGALPADAVISGSPPALLQMFKAATPSAQSRSSVQIRGDAEIANLYRELFAAARPDLEEELSRWIGDLPARHLSQLALSVRTWARRVRRAAGENIAEYLQEEGRDLVTKTEMEEFLRGVDGIRDGVDRVEARLKGLEQRVKGI